MKNIKNMLPTLLGSIMLIYLISDFGSLVDDNGIVFPIIAIIISCGVIIANSIHTFIKKK